MIRDCLQYTLGIVLVGLFVVSLPIAALTMPRPAQAHGPVTVVGGIGTLQETISAGADTAMAVLASQDNFKEMVLDPIAWFAAKALIRAMTQSIVNWINNGFEGSPAFVTDLEGFLLDVVDKEIGNFIYGTELGFLCDPFELDIRMALAVRYKSFEEEIACRLTDIVDNVQGFVEGDFAQGGWDGWYELAVSDSPYNRYLQATGELDIRINGARDLELAQLDWGNGFLSWKECTTRTSGASAGSARAGQDVGVEDCEIVTPGSFIENQLANVAGSGIRQLELADEFNEIVGALISQLASQVMSGSGGGLRGVSRSSGGQPSYLDRLVAESVIPSSPNSTSTQSNPLIAQEQAFRAHVSAALDAVRQSELRLIELRVCNAARANTLLASRINPFKSELEGKLAETDQNIALLRSIDIRKQNATTAAELDSVTRELNTLMGSGQLHDTAEIINEQIRRDNIIAAMNQLNQEIIMEASACTAQGSGAGNNFGP